MKKWALASLVAMMVASSATAAAIIDNNNIYCWGDSDGDRYDNYAVVSPGDTIELEIWVNDLNGSIDIQPDPDLVLVNQSWARAASGAATAVWWDSTVIDGTSVYENKLIPEHLDGDPATETTYYSRRWGYTWGNSTLPHYYMRQYYGKFTDAENPTAWVAEGKHVINMSFTIREDAPLGETTLGLEQMFYWESFGGVYPPTPFFRERIESDDPFAMTLLVMPDGRVGDFTNATGDGTDSVIDAFDIDALADAILNGGDIATFDLVIDGVLDSLDMDMLIQQLVDTTIVDAGEDYGFVTGTFYGDFNLDGTVSLLDLNKLTSNYNGLGGWTLGDANGDGAIALLDLNKLTANYNSTVVVPEPATMTLLGLGAVAILRRRSR
jgi:hypothetical protein